jgi:hypothetical protein
MTDERPLGNVDGRSTHTHATPLVDLSAVLATVGVVALCWVVAVQQMKGMNMGVATTLGSFSFSVAAWVSMMAAMMLPGALPASAAQRSRKRSPRHCAPVCGVIPCRLDAGRVCGLCPLRAAQHQSGRSVDDRRGPVRADSNQAGLSAQVSRTPLGIRVRVELRRLQRRPDAPLPGRQCDEHYLDVRCCPARARSEAAATLGGDRRPGRLGDCWTRRRNNIRAVLVSRTNAGVIRRLKHSDLDAWLDLWRAISASIAPSSRRKRRSRPSSGSWLGPANWSGSSPKSTKALFLDSPHLLFHPSTWSTDPYCYLEDLFVSVAARGTSTARDLVAAAYAAADRRGAARTYWQTQQYNGAARSLYD